MTRDEQIACLQELARAKEDLEQIHVELVITRMELDFIDERG